jgi:hypothetical protein
LTWTLENHYNYFKHLVIQWTMILLTTLKPLIGKP